MTMYSHMVELLARRTLTCDECGRNISDEDIIEFLEESNDHDQAERVRNGSDPTSWPNMCTDCAEKDPQ